MTTAEALAYATRKTTDTLPYPIPDVFDAMFTPAARVRELEGRTCRTCRYLRRIGVTSEYDSCNKLYVSCKAVGHTCGAWKAKATS